MKQIDVYLYIIPLYKDNIRFATYYWEEHQDRKLKNLKTMKNIVPKIFKDKFIIKIFLIILWTVFYQTCKNNTEWAATLKGTIKNIVPKIHLYLMWDKVRVRRKVIRSGINMSWFSK